MCDNSDVSEVPIVQLCIKQDKNKPVIFTMARLDRVKNMTGLVELFARSQRLRKLANLVFVGGVIDPEKSGDRYFPVLSHIDAQSHLLS